MPSHDRVRVRQDPNHPEWVLAHRREVGLRIRDARQAAKITQERLAEQAGVERRTMIQIEFGRSGPSLGVLVKRGVEADAGAGHGQHDAVGVPFDLGHFAEYESHRRIPHVGGAWWLHVTVRISVVPSGPTS
ncbi:helix-turn-helix transcriptional regulator [Streptodolium elevatio]